MSAAKKKKYENKMKNQPSNVTFPFNGNGDNRLQEHNYRDGGAALDSRTSGVPSGLSDERKYVRPSHGPNKAWQTPKYITATKFAQARAAEISAMLKAVSQKSGSQLYKSLPKHMRRRAMGHDVKRLPRRLRQMAQKEMDKVADLKKVQSKSKCRKARRRHGNLQQVFNRRQMKNIWLETHIWHAKRFHMVKKWGYCLGERPTAKCYRACYRAMTSHCLLQDFSYYCCLELVGKEEELLKVLLQVSSAEAGPTFAASHHLSGKRQGSLVLYKKDKYPHTVLGPVTFIWKPRQSSDSAVQSRQLWIWTHPTLKQDVLAELRAICQCVSKTATIESTTECVGRKRKRTSTEGEAAVPLKKILGDGTRDPLEVYSWNSESTGITISDLTMEIVRYRLIGPLSHSVLAESLKAASLHKEKETSQRDPHGWWTEYCKDSVNVSLHNQQSSVLQLLQAVRSPAEVPSGAVLGLTLGDPRLNLPNKRTKAVPDLNREDEEKVRRLTLEGVPVECAKSLMWDKTIRDSVTENKISEQEINRLRRELLVPGSKLELGISESKIPILLIQQPGKVAGEERRGWGAGWDICLPKGWGMAFWIAFIYRGARIGGLKEGLTHSLFKGTPHIPNDFPDCPAGVQTAKEVEATLLEKYMRHPPAKRTNYVKHGSVAPFLCPWKQLAQEWEARSKSEAANMVSKAPESKELKPRLEISTQADIAPAEEATVQMEITQEIESRKDTRLPDVTENVEAQPEIDQFSVVRCRRAMKQLSFWCRPYSRKAQRSSKTPKLEMTPADSEPLMRSYPRSLVWVRLTLLKKGNPEKHSMICIPLQEDFLQLSRDQMYCGPLEPKHRDIFKHKIVQLKKMKKKAKKSKRSQRDGSSSLKDASGTAEGGSDEAESDSGTVSGDLKAREGNAEEGHEDLTLGLWPHPLPDVSSHCSRLVIGFVTQGDFSFAMGCGEAVGFVSLTGLLQMLARQPFDRRGTVLVRDPGSLQYRFGELKIEI